MKGKKTPKNNWIEKIKNDYTFRTFVFSALSFLATVAFTGYNTFLAVVYQSAWNTGIAVYYALLLCMRAYVIFSEYKLRRRNAGESAKKQRRKQIFSISPFFLQFP